MHGKVTEPYKPHKSHKGNANNMTNMRLASIPLRLASTTSSRINCITARLFSAFSIQAIARPGQAVALVLLSLQVSSNVSAQTPVPASGVIEPQYDVYQLSAEAEIDVANDLMTVNLIATATGSDPAELANKINATMGWAVAQLGPFTAIDSQTLDYQTRPQYERNGSRIKGWVSSQSIQLETDNFEQAGKAIQMLQERMQVQGMRHKAKADTRERAEERLINTALEAFKRRALLVQTNMGARGYRVMNLSINTSGVAPHFRDQQSMRGAVSKMSESSAPAIEAGTSTVRVHINGSIQLE